MGPLESVAKSNLVKTSQLIGRELLRNHRNKTHLAERCAEMLGPHDLRVTEANQHARSEPRRSGHLGIDVEVRQLAGSALQSRGAHAIPGAPRAQLVALGR